jgi:hypothetical protein
VSPRSRPDSLPMICRSATCARRRAFCKLCACFGARLCIALVEHLSGSHQARIALLSSIHQAFVRRVVRLKSRCRPGSVQLLSGLCPASVQPLSRSKKGEALLCSGRRVTHHPQVGAAKLTIVNRR